MNLILASNSPRRTEILNNASIKHLVIPSNNEEIINKDASYIDVVETLSYQKAYSVYQEHKNDLVLGADTIVVVDGMILGKPVDEKDAYRMLKLISGRTHEVVTGVTLISKDYKKSFHEITYVEVKKLSDDDIYNYIKEENVFDKAGSYAIQGIFAKYITKFDGEYYNVVGLPLERLKKELKELNYEIQ